VYAEFRADLHHLAAGVVAALGWGGALPRRPSRPDSADSIPVTHPPHPRIPLQQKWIRGLLSSMALLGARRAEIDRRLASAARASSPSRPRPPIHGVVEVLGRSRQRDSVRRRKPGMVVAMIALGHPRSRPAYGSGLQ
jgi:hypothetical protein